MASFQNFIAVATMSKELTYHIEAWNQKVARHLCINISKENSSAILNSFG
jgi:hypothetical protein